MQKMPHNYVGPSEKRRNRIKHTHTMKRISKYLRPKMMINNYLNKFEFNACIHLLSTVNSNVRIWWQKRILLTNGKCAHTSKMICGFPFVELGCRCKFHCRKNYFAFTLTWAHVESVNNKSEANSNPTA